MNTEFILRLEDISETLAQSAAREAFDLLEYLEARLSLYREGSDVRRINAMQAGESLVISETTHQCLLQAIQLNQDTGGHFDVTIGQWIQQLKHVQPNKDKSIHGSLSIDPNRPVINCIEAGRKIDLGGIGKGFALDFIKNVLIDLDILSGSFSAGASCHTVWGTAQLQCRIGPDLSESVVIENSALSASGDMVQGLHILNPNNPTEMCTGRAWVLATSAAAADAGSTAAVAAHPNHLHSLFNAASDVLQAWYWHNDRLIHWKRD
jgi:thiamine biosynthesis lipoprotein